MSGTAGPGGVTGFAVIDGGANYTFEVAATRSGNVTVEVPAGAARDMAGSPNAAPASLSIEYDGTRPGTRITSPQAPGPTNATVITFNVTFGQPVTGFESTEIDVGGNATTGGLANFGGSDGDTVYTFELVPTGDGTVEIDVAAGVAQNLLGNDNTAAPRLSIRTDRTAPVPLITTTQPDPTGSAVVDFNVGFNETVAGFAAADIVLSGATTLGGVTGFARTNGGANYTFEVELADAGTVTVGVPAGAAADLAGSPNTAPASLSIEYDDTRPDTAITSEQAPGPTNATVLNFEVTFGQPVTGFEPGEITVGGNATTGGLTNFGGADGDTVYTFELVPTGDGTVEIDVAAGTAQNRLGNDNTAAPGLSIRTDRTAPVPLITTTQPDRTGSAVIDFNVGFNETVEGFGAADIAVSGTADPGAVTNFTRIDGGANYTFEVAATQSGTVTAGVPAGAARDLAGSPNAVPASLSIEYDTSRPDTRITSPQAPGPTNATVINFNVTFTHDVTGFAAGDIVLSGRAAAGGTVADFARINATNYSFDVAPTADGNVTVNVGAGVALNALGNENTAAPALSIRYDGTAPVPVITSARPDPTGSAVIDFNVGFNETVTHFDETDIDLSGGTAPHGGVTGFARTNGGANYTFEVTATAGGTVRADVPAGAARDLAGSPNAVPASLSIEYDATRPGTRITSEQTGPTNATVLGFNVTFTHDVTGFAAGDIVLSGDAVTGGVTGFATINATNYSFDVVPTADGNVTVNVGAGVARNDLGNENTAAAPHSIRSDRTPPVPRIITTQPDPTGSAVIDFNVGFNETVTGFAAADIVLSGATTLGGGGVTGFARTNGGANYTFEVELAAGGTVTVGVPAGAAADLAGSPNAVPASLSVEYDATRPDTAIASEQAPGPTNATILNFNVTFGQPVTGFEPGEITVGGNATTGGLTNFGGGDGDTVYTFELVPTGDGTVEIDVAAGAAQNRLGNDNTAAPKFSLRSDRTAPVPLITTTQPNPTGSATVDFRIGFNETVKGFGAADIAVSGTSNPGGVTNFARIDGGANYTFEVTATAGGTVRADVPAGAARDLAGSPNTEAASLSIEYDATRPGTRITSPQAPGPTNATVITFNVTFGQPVTGFDRDGIALSGRAAAGGTVADFVRINATDYSFDVAPTADGNVTVNVGPGAARNDLGNENTAAPAFSIRYDGTAPVPVITSTQPDPTGSAVIDFNVGFNETVTHFDETDIDLSGGTAPHGGVTGFARTNGGANYTFEVELAAGGTVTVGVPTRAATDLAGSPNTEAASLSIEYDATRPYTRITSPQAPGPTNATVINFNVTFGQPVTGFDRDGIALSGRAAAGGTVADFVRINATDYSFDVVPTADGNVTVNVGAGAARNDLGNENTAAPAFSIRYDGTAPVPVITSTQPDPTGSAVIDFNVGFNETVKGFAAADIVLSGATTLGAGVTGFARTNGGANYTFEVELAAGGTVTVGVPTRAATDLAGSPNTEAASLSIEYDATRPYTRITSPQAPGPTNATVINFNVTFGQPVTGFDRDGIALSGRAAAGGTVADFVRINATDYSFDVVPTADGNVTVNVGAGAARNDLGNENTAAPAFSIRYDGTAPVPVITSTQPDPTGSAVIDFNVGFNETVTHFDETDIDLSGGTAPHGGVTGFARTNGGANYTFEVTATAGGTVTAEVPAGAARDTAGSPNTEAASLSIQYDDTRPYTRITSPQAPGPTNATVINFNVTFGQPVTGFDRDGIALSGRAAAGGTVADFVRINATDYSFDVVPTADGNVTVNVGAGAARNDLGNENTAAPAFSIRYDGTAPVPVITSTQPDPTGSAVIDFNVGFNETVTHFDETDIDLSGGTAPHGGVTGFARTNGGANYTFEVTATAGGTVRAEVPAGAARDLAGSPNTEAASLSIQYDDTRPYTRITSPQAPGPTNATVLNFNVTFGQPVTGFDRDGIALSGRAAAGGTVADFVRINATDYSFDVVPTADGNVTVNVGAGAARNDLGNENTAAPAFSIRYDGTAPVPVITSTQPDPTGSAVIDFNVGFNETVTHFDETDIDLSGGTAPHGGVTGFARTNGGANYTFEVTATAGGTVRADVPAGAARDLAGSPNTAAASLSIQYDDTRPYTRITSPQAPGPTNATVLNFNVTFGQPVSGFAAADIALSGRAAAGGTVADFVRINATDYSFDVVPTADGNVTVNVGAGAARNDLGNENTAAPAFSIRYDGTAPVPVITSTQPDPTGSAVIDFNVGFNETVTHFDETDIDLSGGTAPHGGVTGFARTNGGANYTFEVTATAGGTVRADVPAGAARDLAGSPNTAAASLSIQYDDTRPYTRITSPQAPGPTNATVINFNVTFGQPVTGFDRDGIALSGRAAAGGTVADFVRINSTDYSFDVVPTADGNVTVNVGAGAARNDLGNENTAAPAFSIRYDGTAPVPVITSTQPDPTGSAVIDFNVGFNETVTHFDETDIDLSGGTAPHGGVTGFARTNGGANYTFEVTATAGGTVRADVPAGAARDLAGSPNTAAASLSIQYDDTRPYTRITSPQAPGPTNATVLNFNVTFGQPVSGFAAADIALSGRAAAGGTVADFVRINATDYSFDVVPTADGNVTVNVGAGAARNDLGNENTAAPAFSIRYDGTAPVPVITSTQPDPTGSAVIDFNVGFNETVTHFDETDIDLSGGTAPHGGVTGFARTNGGANYTFEVTATAGGTVRADVPAGAARDLAGSPNTAAASLSIQYDDTRPYTRITSPQAPGPTNATVLNFNVAFGQPVSGFAAADIALSGRAAAGGTVADFVRINSTDYSFDVVPTADGNVTVNVGAGAARNELGNENTAAVPYSIRSDRTPPVPRITSTQPDPTGSAVIDFNVGFNETVTGFAAADIVLSGATTLGGGVTGFARTNGGANYTFEVELAAGGTVTVGVPAHAAADLAGSPNAAPASLSMEYDASRPGTSITSEQAPGPTNATVINFNVAFGQPVTGFAAGDIALSGDARPAGADNFARINDTHYSFDAVPGRDGIILVDVGEGAAENLLGNPSTAAAQLQIRSDRTPPVPVITTTQPDPTGSATVDFRIGFNETVKGFAAGNIAVSGSAGPGGVTNFARIDGGANYTFEVTATRSGTVTVEVPAAAAADLAGSPNAAPAGLSIGYDGTRPGTAITSEQAPGPTNATTLNFNVTFSQPVSGFDAADIELSGDARPAGADNFARINATNYSFDVAPAADGNVTVNVGAGAALNDLGHGNTAAPALSIRYDGTAPVPVITSTRPDPPGSAAIGFNVGFNETVTGFGAADIDLSGGTATHGGVASFARIDGGANYTFEVLPASDGTIVVGVAAGVARDDAGNPNAAAARFRMSYDGTNPYFVQAFVTANNSVAVVYTEPVLPDRDHYTGITVDGTPVGHRGGNASAATPFGGSVLVSWESDTDTAAAAAPGSVVAFTIAAVTDAAGNPLGNPDSVSVNASRHVRIADPGTDGRGGGPPRIGTVDIPAVNHTIIQSISTGGITPAVWLDPAGNGGRDVLPRSSFNVSSDLAAVVFPPAVEVTGLPEPEIVVIARSDKRPSGAFGTANPGLDLDGATAVEFGNRTLDLGLTAPARVEIPDLGAAAFSINSTGHTLLIPYCGGGPAPGGGVVVVGNHTAAAQAIAALALRPHDPGTDTAACRVQGTDTVWTEHFSAIGAADPLPAVPPPATPPDPEPERPPPGGRTTGGGGPGGGGRSSGGGGGGPGSGDDVNILSVSWDCAAGSVGVVAGPSSENITMYVRTVELGHQQAVRTGSVDVAAAAAAGKNMSGYGIFAAEMDRADTYIGVAAILESEEGLSTASTSVVVDSCTGQKVYEVQLPPLIRPPLLPLDADVPGNMTELPKPDDAAQAEPVPVPAAPEPVPEPPVPAPEPVPEPPVPAADPLPEPAGPNCGPGTIERDGICIVILPAADARAGAGDCLIAAVAHGTDLAPPVQRLRDLRDHAVLPTPFGSSFLDAVSTAYYAFSPDAADMERRNPAAGALALAVMTPAIWALDAALPQLAGSGSEAQVAAALLLSVLLLAGIYAGPPAIAAYAVAAYLLPFLRRRRRRRAGDRPPPGLDPAVRSRG